MRFDSSIHSNENIVRFVPCFLSCLKQINFAKTGSGHTHKNVYAPKQKRNENETKTKHGVCVCLVAGEPLLGKLLLAVRKNASLFWRHSHTKNDYLFYQDRLGTNIGKKHAQNRCVFLCAFVGHSNRHFESLGHVQNAAAGHLHRAGE